MMSDDILWELEIKHYMENQKRESLEEGEEKGFQRGRQDGIEEGMILGEKSGIEKGIALGKKDGEIRTLLSLVKEGLLPLDKAVEKSRLTEKEFKERLGTL